jgi:hypothetical protein
MSNRAAKLARSRRRGAKRTHEQPPRHCPDCHGTGYVRSVDRQSGRASDPGDRHDLITERAAIYRCRRCAGTGAGTLRALADALERGAWLTELDR